MGLHKPPRNRRGRRIHFGNSPDQRSMGRSSQLLPRPECHTGQIPITRRRCRPADPRRRQNRCEFINPTQQLLLVGWSFPAFAMTDMSRLGILGHAIDRRANE